MGWVLVVLLSIGTGGAAAVAAAAADTERIADLFVSAEVTSGDPGVRVTEVIDYDFGPSPRRGIFRDIPDVPITIEPSVFSPTAPDRFGVEFAPGGDTRIRIGDPDITITGRHRYQLSYPLPQARQGESFGFDAVGDGWEVPIERAEIHVTSAFELDDVTCSKGSRGDEGGCDARELEPGRLLVEVEDLDPGTGVTITADLGPLLAEVPEAPVPPSGAVVDPGTGVGRPAVAAVLAAFLGAFPAVAVTRRLGREQAAAGGAADVAFAESADGAGITLADAADLSQLATVEFAPPGGVTPSQAGVLLHEAIRKEHSTAWLLSQAIYGAVELEEVDGDPVIRRTDVPAPLADDQAILNAIFGGRREVTLDSYDATFAKGWARVATSLETWLERSPLWCPEGRARRRRFGAIAGLTLLGGLAVGGLGAAFANRAGGPWLLAVAAGALAVGFGLGLLVRRWELMVRTPQGTAVWLRTLSFRRFLAESEAHHVEWAAQHGMLREYTAWAVALGEADHWAKVVERSNVDLEGHGAYDAVRFVHLAPTLERATSTASTAPSSSGGGGGGFSGGVGGGAGGGGGGSW